MNDVLSALKVNNFDTLLKAYSDASLPLSSCIDGGAGSGARLSQCINI
tara:strand:+ start:331 stop:474 length:144 start_codon:yes stop_codon:yes gene_type:complete